MKTGRNCLTVLIASLLCAALCSAPVRAEDSGMPIRDFEPGNTAALYYGCGSPAALLVQGTSAEKNGEKRTISLLEGREDQEGSGEEEGPESGNTAWLFLLAAAAAAVCISAVFLQQKRKRDRNAHARRKRPASGGADSRGPIQPDPTWLGDKKEELYLCCRGGYQDGREFPLRDGVRIGRSEECDIRYPEKHPGISRIHVTVEEENGRVYLTDQSSTEVFLKKGSIGDRRADRIPKKERVEIFPGDVFYLAARENRFELMKK